MQNSIISDQHACLQSLVRALVLLVHNICNSSIDDLWVKHWPPDLEVVGAISPWRWKPLQL